MAKCKALMGLTVKGLSSPEILTVCKRNVGTSLGYNWDITSVEIPGIGTVAAGLKTMYAFLKNQQKIYHTWNQIFLDFPQLIPIVFVREALMFGTLC